jgi:hypothetical protein
MANRLRPARGPARRTPLSFNLPRHSVALDDLLSCLPAAKLTISKPAGPLPQGKHTSAGLPLSAWRRGR